MRLARELYQQCVAEDPEYAPAWARLGRIRYFLCKWEDSSEETLESTNEAFQRAFALNPDLALAHNLYTLVECDTGRAREAMVRLLKRAHSRRHDAELFTGLVHACRYCEELEASAAAHQRARQLDPNANTSIAHTHFLLGEYEKVLEHYSRASGAYLDAAALACAGQEDEALKRLEERDRAGRATGTVRAIICSLLAFLRGDVAGCLREIDSGAALAQRDPESLFYIARHLARVGQAERALDLLNLVLDCGFLCTLQIERDPWLASVKALPGCAALLDRGRWLREQAHAAFLAAGGEEILSPRRAGAGTELALQT
jgi:tetratricopeptide (TPR) repeat protein